MLFIIGSYSALPRSSALCNCEGYMIDSAQAHTESVLFDALCARVLIKGSGNKTLAMLTLNDSSDWHLACSCNYRSRCRPKYCYSCKAACGIGEAGEKLCVSAS